ncbi:MAG: roadblock/LC7 domain-containing protein [Thermodesulfobacteriota bacterium]
MDFLKIIKDMVHGVEGGLAGTIMGMDGIPIQSYAKEGAGIDTETLLVEYIGVLSEIKKASEVLKLGETEEIIITLGRVRIVLRIISKEYFAAFILSHDGNLGKARYYLKKAAIVAAGELGQ